MAIKHMRKQCVPGALSSPSSAPGNEANIVVSLSPFRLESAFVFEAQIYRTVSRELQRSCRFECFMVAGHEAVIHIKMSAASE